MGSDLKGAPKGRFMLNTAACSPPKPEGAYMPLAGPSDGDGPPPCTRARLRGLECDELDSRLVPG